jgi:hypothetical protein
MAYSDLPHRVAASPRTLALALALAASSCVWIDDFDKFKAMGERDASLTTARDSSTPDAAAADEDSGRAPDAAQNTGKCADVDCSRLDTPCAHGVCNPSTGECESKNTNDGDRCFDDNPCTYDERCTAGTCAGKAVDCSAFDDECSQGVCDTKNGGCTYGPNNMSKACNDLNACTENDRCGADGHCSVSTMALKGTICSDFEDCTGVNAMPDSCDGNGTCIPGGPASAGTSCDDDNTCTDDDHCDGDGSCVGSAVHEGQPCHEACAGNMRCQSGVCATMNDVVPTYDQRCVQNFCGISNICPDEWKNDRVCQCGCSFEDSACNDCSARMCQSDPDQGHLAERWCDQSGHAVDNCPASLKHDGKCDCGCQFVDPDCGGGSCCQATGKAGCDDTFIETCVCKHETDAAPECCDDEWTQRCADLAVNLGCMACP